MQRQTQPGLAPRAPPMKPEALVAGEHAAADAAKYRGVRRRSSSKWAAEIWQPPDRKRLYLSHFDTAQEAVRAYDQAARCLYGDAALLNYPDKAAVTAAADTAAPVEAEQVAGLGKMWQRIEEAGFEV